MTMTAYIATLIERVKRLQDEASFILYVIDECIHHEQEERDESEVRNDPRG